MADIIKNSVDEFIIAQIFHDSHDEDRYN